MHGLVDMMHSTADTCIVWPTCVMFLYLYTSLKKNQSEIALTPLCTILKLKGCKQETIALKSHDNTLVLQHTFWDIHKIRISLWSIKPWAFACELPFQETINGIFKSISEVSGRHVSFAMNWMIYLEVKVSSDILLVLVEGDLNISNVRALILFWVFDASSPATPSFLTYIQEEEYVKGLYLNSKYFCRRKRETLEVFSVDDIKNNATRKSWFVRTFGSEGDDDDDNIGLLEGGKSNRFAVFSWRNNKVFELDVFNIGSGDHLFNLQLNTLDRLIIPGLRRIRRTEPIMKFQLGKLIFFQPLESLSDTTKIGYQIVIIDEKARDNQVVVGAYLDLHESKIRSNGDDPIYMSSNYIVKNVESSTYVWKLET